MGPEPLEVPEGVGVAVVPGTGVEVGRGRPLPPPPQPARTTPAPKVKEAQAPRKNVVIAMGIISGIWEESGRLRFVARV